MNKEKIVLGNKKELEYDQIGFRIGCLVIGFVGGDMAALEQDFRNAGQDNLEVIKQIGADGAEQTTHERFDIFREIRKAIGTTPEEDVVEVVLEQEGLLEMKIRHLEAGQESLQAGQEIQDGAIADLGEVVSAVAGGEEINL